MFWESEWSRSVVSDSTTPWTVAHQAPPSMGFSRQEYWSGLPFPSPGDLPNPGIKPRSLALQADSLTSSHQGSQRCFNRLQIETVHKNGWKLFWILEYHLVNFNPLQCSCLENPRDGGAWWAAVYGVSESRTRLKWLSSSIPLKLRQ